ncbi:MAG: hypothetical protein HQL52_02435 [Magnetococcales bacterium]|nr:hypothetical protein [Magnetococcales bacterium]
MSSRDNSAGWVPLTDYILKGVRVEKRPAVTEETLNALPTPPTDWVPLSDYLLKGVRKKKPSLEALSRALEAEKPLPPPAPEVQPTFREALADVHAALDQEGGVASRLGEIVAQCERQFDAGKLDRALFEQAVAGLEKIRADYQNQTHEVIGWFLDHYSVDLPTPSPASEPDPESTD